MSKIRVAVLMGGRSAERQVSLSTGRQVLAALDPARYEAFPVDTACLGMSRLTDPTRALGGSTAAEPGSTAWVTGEGLAGLPAPDEAPLVGENRPDVAVICLHGRYGEDGTVQGMLELLDIPYTGSGVLASALAMDKVMSKKVFQIEGIPTPPAVTLRGRAEADAYLRALQAGDAEVDCPAVVKPSRQGSTIGISIVRDRADMAAALDTALAYDADVLVEKFVEGMEITGPVLGNEELECLPLVEIVPNDGFYDYEAKYTPGATDEIVPARLSPEQTRAAQELAVRAHQALGCRGFSRTDMLVADDGIWVLEVNTIPGMTPTSLLPRSAEAAGIPFSALLDRMIALALEGRTVEPTTAARP
jgi:D-alanine-D-alanine ligase